MDEKFHFNSSNCHKIIKDILEYISLKIKVFAKKNIKLNKKIISLEAIAWLKIFIIRQWSKRDPIYNTDRFVIPEDFNGLSDEIKDAINILKCYKHRDLLMIMEDQRYLHEVIMEEKEKGKKIGFEKGENFGLEKGERKSNLSTILNVLKNWSSLKNWKFLTEYFSKNELEIIKDFEENPYDLKTFAEKIKIKEEDILDICESIGIEIGKKMKLKYKLFYFLL